MPVLTRLQSKNLAQSHELENQNNESIPRKLDTDGRPQKRAKIDPKIETVPRLNNHHGLFQLPQIIEGLGRNGNVQDLLKLKQISQSYYELLNDSYLDGRGKTIRIARCPILGSLLVETLSADGTPERQITSYNWRIAFRHLFRKLELGDIWDYSGSNGILTGDKSKGIRLSSFISKLGSSNITSLTLRILPHNPNLVNPGAQLSQFINTFYNLKELNIHYNTLSIDQLGILYASVTSSNDNIQINLFVDGPLNFDEEDALIAFAATKLTNFKLIFRVRKRWLLERLENQSGNIPNICYDVRLSYNNGQSITSVEDLESLTTFCVKNKHYIQELVLEFNIGALELWLRNMQREAPDQEFVSKCLTDLSPILNEFKLSQSKALEFDILSSNTEWSRLESLHITGYIHPLLMLTKCQKLRELTLHVDLDSCFSSKSLPHDKHNLLEEIFGNLLNLKMLTFIIPLDSTYRDYGKEEDSTKFHSKLKKVLPKDTIIKYSYWEPIIPID